MGKSCKIDFSGLEKFAKKLEKVSEAELQAFCESCAKELAARLLALVIKRTPVGDYPNKSYKKGGTLRRGWTVDTEEEAESNPSTPSAPEQKARIEGCTVTKDGSAYTIELINPVFYASYVESGHRTPNHKDWVNGQYMLKISEDELKKQAPAILEKKIEKWLGEVLG